MQLGVAMMQSRQSLAAQPMHIQLHDGSVRFGSALAWITCKQATVMAGLVALLQKHLEQATVRLPIMMQLAEVGTAAACTSLWRVVLLRRGFIAGL